MYICKICNKDFKQSSNLKAHENRKIKCSETLKIAYFDAEIAHFDAEIALKSESKIINDKNKDATKISCKYCNKIFTRNSIKNNHEEKCKKNDVIIYLDQLKKLNDNLINENNELKNINNKLIDENNKLKNKII